MFWRLWHSTHPHVKSGCKMLLSQNSVHQAHPGSSKHVQICAKSVKVDNVDFASSFMFFDWYKGDKDNQVDTQCCLGSADINYQRQKLDEIIWCWMRWRKQTMFSQHHTNSVPQVRCHSTYNLPCVQKKAPFVGKTVHRHTHSNKKTLAIELEHNFLKTGRCE